MSASFTLLPTATNAATEPGGPRGTTGFILNGVKIDASTAGSCDDSGTDDNNAHVQPDGAYHYHGMPEGYVSAVGGSSDTMTMIGWAADGSVV